MAITQRIVKQILKTEIHPYVVRHTLYDRHIEDRLPILIEVEKAFKEKYDLPLFLHVDMESCVVTYDVEALRISLQCGWTGWGKP